MNENIKKALSIAKTVLVWVLTICAVGIMIFTIISVKTFDKNNRSLFGYKMYIVLSDSMSTTDGDDSKGYFDAGDLILVKEVKDPSKLEAGDIISYISTNPENFGETVTHMIRSKTKDASGSPGFVTYGTSTGENDANVVTYPYILGSYSGKLPAVGRFFNFLKTTPGYIVCIFLPFLLLILIQGFNSIQLFRKYKAEQLAELEAAREKERAELEAEREKERAALEAERAAMAEERKKQEEMMQQLLAMQAAMQGGKAVPSEPTASAEENTSSEG